MAGVRILSVLCREFRQVPLTNFNINLVNSGFINQMHMTAVETYIFMFLSFFGA